MSSVTAPYGTLAIRTRNGDARSMALQSSPVVGPRSDHPAVRWTIIGVAVLFLSLFIILPLVNVFAMAFSKGGAAYLAAITEPDARAAIVLTLIVALISVTLNLV